MIIYLYDGSFPGLLTAIYEAFYRENKPERIVKENELQPGLFDRKVKIITDEEKSDKVYEAVEQKISHRALKRIYNCFLSGVSGIERDILYYLRLGFKMGSDVDGHLTEDRILRIKKISDRVSKEKHRLKGLLRFRELEAGMMYAPVEPDYDTIALLAPHFARRMANLDWIIHDRKRKKAVLYNQEEWVVTEMEKLEMDFTGKEEHFQDLWREFFAAIAISDRENKTLQRNFMPRRYWKHLVEKS
ncbi:MAG: TIGR03915 family putative DNA repair protein [Halanaerobiaceae bacterium]